MDKKLFSVAAAYESMNQVANEALDDKDKDTVKDVIKGLKKAVNIHKGQAASLTKDIKDDVKKEALDDKDKSTMMKVAKKLKKASAAHAGQSDAIMKDIKDDVKKEDVTSADRKPENVVGPDGKTRVRMVPMKKKSEAKLDPVGKADADIDNDGDVDKSDEYLHNRRKAIKKAMKKEDTDIRGRLMSIWEDAAEITEADRAAHYKGATKPEPMNKADADQKMYDAHQNPDKHGGEESKKAETSGPGGKSARTNDAKLGDKEIINKIANAYKQMQVDKPGGDT